MKRILCIFLSITFLLIVTPSAFALIRTRNVDIDDGGFGYKVSYQFATTDVGGGQTAIELPTDATINNQYYYTMPFKGSIVGISIASNTAITRGSVTADVTINGAVTGVRTALDGGATAKWSRSGQVADHRQFNYNTILFDTDIPDDFGGGTHDTIHPYGKATALTAGDRIGVKLTTSTGAGSLLPGTAEMNITVMVLQ